MEQNKTGKYLKYAIGEILLVVIGILIALSINNWNEQSKNENVKQVYLKSLIAELKNNCDTYKSLQTDFDERITSYNLLFKNLNSKNPIKIVLKMPLKMQIHLLELLKLIGLHLRN